MMFVNEKGGGISDPAAFRLALGLSAEVLTMQNLRDLDVSNIGSIGFARTGCHSVATDLGGGIFIWAPGSTEADNNVTTVTPTGRVTPGRWVRYEILLNPFIVNVAWAGARPNIPGYDNAPHFNTAIQALPLYSSSGTYTIPGGFMRRGILQIPGGNWYVSDTINASQGMAIFGSGSFESLIVLNSGASGFQNANTEKWVVYYHRDEDVPYNNVFGSRAKDFTIDGALQPGSSGIFISGAQNSFCRDVCVSNTGIRGGVFNVPADEVWVNGCIQGPGFECSIGPAMIHGVIRSEHINQSALHTMTLSNGDVIPRPAFLFSGAYGLIIRSYQGETSPFEMVFDNCVGIQIGDGVSRAPDATTINGYPTTKIYLAGDTYQIRIGSDLTAVAFSRNVYDRSGLAISQIDTGIQATDFWKNRNGLPTSNVNPTYPGPYANDAAAAASKQVPVGAAYRVTGGNIAWRQS